MKTIAKLLAALAVIAGIVLLIYAYLAREDKPDYIPIYGGPRHDDPQ